MQSNPIAHAIYLASQTEDIGRTAWLWRLEQIADAVANFLEGKGFNRAKFIAECGLQKQSGN